MVVPDALVLAVRVVDEEIQVSTPPLLLLFLIVTVIFVKLLPVPRSPDRANSGCPGREERKIKDRMVRLCLFRSKANFIYIGLIYEAGKIPIFTSVNNDRTIPESDYF